MSFSGIDRRGITSNRCLHIVLDMSQGGKEMIYQLHTVAQVEGLTFLCGRHVIDLDMAEVPGPLYSYTYTITSWLNRKKLTWEIHAQAVYTDGQKPTEETEYTARVRRGTKSRYIDIPILQHEW